MVEREELHVKDTVIVKYGLRCGNELLSMLGESADLVYDKVRALTPKIVLFNVIYCLLYNFHLICGELTLANNGHHLYCDILHSVVYYAYVRCCMC